MSAYDFRAKSDFSPLAPRADAGSQSPILEADKVGVRKFFEASDPTIFAGKDSPQNPTIRIKGIEYTLVNVRIRPTPIDYNSYLLPCVANKVPSVKGLTLHDIPARIEVDNSGQLLRTVFRYGTGSVVAGADGKKRSDYVWRTRDDYGYDKSLKAAARQQALVKLFARLDGTPTTIVLPQGGKVSAKVWTFASGGLKEKVELTMYTTVIRGVLEVALGTPGGIVSDFFSVSQTLKNSPFSANEHIQSQIFNKLISLEKEEDAFLGKVIA